MEVGTDRQSQSTQNHLVPHFCPKHGRWGGDRKNRLPGLTLFYTLIWFKCSLLFSYFPHPGIILAESLRDKGECNQVDQLCCWPCICRTTDKHSTYQRSQQPASSNWKCVVRICLQIAISGITCSEKKKASHYPVVYLPGERAAKCLHYLLNIHLFYLLGLYLDFLFCSLLVLIFCSYHYYLSFFYSIFFFLFCLFSPFSFPCPLVCTVIICYKKYYLW